MSERKRQSKTVRGYIVEVPSSKDGSDEDEDDDEDDNWLDYSQIRNAFSQGVFVKQSKKPRYCRVALKDLDNIGKKQTHSCHGRFVLVDPWWEITVTIDPSNRAQGLTQYKVRQDEDGIRRQNLVPFLLTTALKRCRGADEAHKLMTQLEQFISNRLQGRKLTFEDIEPQLYQFSLTYPHHKVAIAQAKNQDTVQAVLRGLRYPDLLQFLNRLFPLTFLGCLLSPKAGMLDTLQTAAAEEPWVFGFKAIMASRFNVYGIEAIYKAFEACGLMERTPPAQKDALYIYEVLKTDASRDGHTYISFTHLRQHRHWAQLDHEVTDWASALTFLAENGVTKEERFDSGRNIFLYHNWKAEVDIASGLREILSRGIAAKRPTWDVDFTSPDLNRLQGDDDQWMAAQKVVGSPVCIMSGKGGCGKTTVITQVVQHVCQQTPVIGDDVPENMFDIDDMLANAQLHEVAAAPAGGKQTSSSPPAPPQVTQEQLSQMIQTATQALEESQAQETRRLSSQKDRKRDQIQIDLITDLIKFLGTICDTALSQTPNGRRILLAAPTGKAAKLLGHKAKMESCTLHLVIYSYRAFIKQQQKNQAEKNKRKGDDENEEMNDEVKDNLPNDRGRTSRQDKQIKPTPASDSPENQDEDLEGTWKYADTEVLIVDECSLVSLRLFATVLNILIQNTPLWKIVLLGDVRQLPSIEPGNFLSDMFTTFGVRGLSVELQTNHRSESELIVRNATRISQCQLPIIDPGQNFHVVVTDDSNDCDDPERDAAVRDLLCRPELQSHETSQFVAFRRVDCEAINELCCKHYNDHTTREARGSKHRYDFRVGDKICFRRNGQVLNQGLRLRGYLKDHPYILEAFGIAAGQEKGRREKASMDVTEAAEEVVKSCGDGRATEEHPGSSSSSGYHVQTTEFGVKMEHPSQTEPGACGHRLRLSGIGLEDCTDREPGSSQDNCSFSSGQEKEDGEERAGKLKNGEVRLCNGEVFFVMDEEAGEEGGKESRFLTLSDRDPECPRVVCVSYAALKQKCRLYHAWARTIHTYQGSESNTVVYYVGTSKLQNWKHVYTAVTRGRKSVFMVGKDHEMSQAVRRGDRPRRSRLSRRLSDMMKDLPFQELHAMMRSINDQAKKAKMHSVNDKPREPLLHPVAQPHSQQPSTNPSALAPDPTTGPSGVATPPATEKKRLSIDSFPDSDDSWVRDISSPLWAVDEDILEGAARVETQNDLGSPELFLGVRKKVSSPKERRPDESCADESPSKKLCLQEEGLSTPKQSRVRSSDLVDSIISPVNKSLKF